MIRKWLSFRTLSIALAVILAFTAALKLHMLLTDPFADIKSGYSVPLLWLAVFLEAGVVWMVFSKTTDMVKWLGLVSLFGIFTVFSAYNVLIEKDSCGCAGLIEVGPIWFFAFDVAAVAALTIFRASSASEKREASRASRQQVFGKIIGVSFAFAIFLFIKTPNIKTVLNARYLGQEVTADRIHLGNLRVDEPFEFKVTVRNLSNDQRTITGFRKSCTCVVSSDSVGAVIPKRSLMEVALSVVPKKPGDFHQRVVFYLDSKQQYSVAADIFAKVKGK